MPQDSGTASGIDMNENSGLTWYQVAGLLAAIGGSTALGWQGCKKMNAIRIEPQPLEVKAHPDYVSKHEFENYKEEVRDNFKGVHARINTTTTALAEMQGKLDMIAANQDKILNLLMTGRASGAGNFSNRQS